MQWEVSRQFAPGKVTSPSQIPDFDIPCPSGQAGLFCYFLQKWNQE
jgi:hypothetical protein